MLEPIVETTRRRIADLAVSELRAQAGDAPPPRPFEFALVGDRLSVIAEFKRRSPSRGLLVSGVTPEERARQYEAGGAAAISVLTEPDHFDGSDDDLRAVKKATSIPVLRKDFTLDEAQVYQARAIGADAILLIVAILSDAQLAHLHGLAAELDLAVVVEVHTDEEADRALAVS
ncbi:MAG: indole-3-glycerol phosphate synthase TrpC, partial [Acidimicrobiia bacterium]|nr:indole-3-glycerol phosphate synthase TrpC [Acidimicrobiia bacterium]